MLLLYYSMTYPTDRGFVAIHQVSHPMPDRAALALGYTVLQWTENFFSICMYIAI